MSASLNIAASGIDAAQTAMDTIAQNLSNANTPGYVAETANLVANPGGDLLGVGDGSRVVSVTQTNDGLLLANVQQSQGALSQSSALQQVLQQAQLSFQEPSSSGLSADLSSFWQAWDQIAQNPSTPAPRQQVLDLAGNLATDLHQASQELDTTVQNATSELQNDVIPEANRLLKQVAGLNAQILGTQSTGGSPNALIDQRNQAMDQLAKDIGAVGTTKPDGSYQVTVGGAPVVQGGWADSLSLAGSGGTLSIVSNSSQAAVPVTQGTAAGLLAGVTHITGIPGDPTNPGYRGMLDQVANDLAATVNSQLTAGYTVTSSGTPATYTATKGVPLFTPTSGPVTASNIVVGITDPTQLAAASASSVSPSAQGGLNDGSNAQAVADLWNSSSGPDVTYRNLVQTVGDNVSAVNNQVQAQTAVANAAQQNLQAVAGVDPNQQMISLMNFQQAYQASAKVISTTDSAVQSLLAAV